jgi:ribosomal protein L4
MTIAEDDQALSRAPRRALRRIYNGRTVPIVIEGRSFLTFREARDWLHALPAAERDAACAAMLAQAK